MIVGQKYVSSEIDTHYDAIVIGSGLGGLTTAALMAKVRIAEADRLKVKAACQVDVSSLHCRYSVYTLTGKRQRIQVCFARWG